MSQQVSPPDFILIPRQLLVDESLQPLDRSIFGYIYWFTKLKNEKCTASNRTLAMLAFTKPTSIQNSLVRLERGGYVAKIYADESKKNRLEIVCLLSFGGNVPSNDGNVPLNEGTHQQMKVPSNEGQKKSIKRKEKKSSDSTRPREQKNDAAVLATFNAMTSAVGCSAKPEGNSFILDVIAALHRVGYKQDDVVRAAKYVNNPATQDSWMRENLKTPSKALAYLFFTRTRKRDVEKSIESVAQWIATAEEWEDLHGHVATSPVASDGRPIIRRTFGGNNE